MLFRDFGQNVTLKKLWFLIPRWLGSTILWRHSTGFTRNGSTIRLYTLHDHAEYLRKCFVSSFQHGRPGVPSQPCFNFAFLCCELNTKMSCLGKLSIVCHWNFRLFLRLPDSSLEKPQDLPVPPVLFKLLRIGKLARAIRMITMTTMLSCPYSDWAENAGGIKRSLVY